MARVLRSPCNNCGRETDHDVVYEDTNTVHGPSGDILETVKYALKCRGCHDLSFRAEERYYEFAGVEYEDVTPAVTFQPPRLWRRPPDWHNALEDLDPDLFDLLKQVYLASNDEQTKLLSMGVRTALDHLMNKVLRGDFGSFEQKLSEMVTQGHLTGNQKEDLETVIDAGSASSHRGYRPPRDLIIAIITAPMLRTAKANIPPRPPRQKPTRQ